MQLISNDGTVKSKPMPVLKDFNSLSLATQAKRENNCY